VKKLAIVVCVFLTSLVVCAAPASARRQTQKSSEAGKKAPTRKASVKRTSHRLSRHRSYSRRYHGPKKPTSERISEIQSALARGGYYKGDPNGKWDPGTTDAMRKFQEDHGLDGTGKIDALSLQKLGLGSEIAGVDAPRPPAPAQQTLTPAHDATPPAAATPDKPKPQAPKSPDANPGAASSSAHPDAATPNSSALKPGAPPQIE
jgi:peptidoglycan hydrolase-like protein with peptidoglycan-binding domain